MGGVGGPGGYGGATVWVSGVSEGMVEFGGAEDSVVRDLVVVARDAGLADPPRHADMANALARSAIAYCVTICRGVIATMLHEECG